MSRLDRSEHLNAEGLSEEGPPGPFEVANEREGVVLCKGDDPPVVNSSAKRTQNETDPRRARNRRDRRVLFVCVKKGRPGGLIESGRRTSVGEHVPSLPHSERDERVAPVLDGADGGRDC